MGIKIERGKNKDWHQINLQKLPFSKIAFVVSVSLELLKRVETGLTFATSDFYPLTSVILACYLEVTAWNI